jgi:hypothetical protein
MDKEITARYLNIDDAARYLGGVSVSFLYQNWKQYGGFKMGRMLRFDRLELDRILGGKEKANGN